ncbi:MAG: hypothetical protein NTV22_13205 [bacterium]|jgi:hypothetical protein|nr:hypothetical protein [bacterium]MCX7004212.1 hypothetical protein [bacterium]
MTPRKKKKVSDKSCSLKWAIAFMKSVGAREITPEEKRRDPQLRKALRMARS